MYDELMRSDAKKPKRRNDPTGLRSRVLDQAYLLFQSRGYNATGVQEIAAAAGVSGGALHHHFATKKALGLAVIRERVATAVEETWLAPVRHAGNARDGILQVFGDLADELDRNGAVRGCPVNNLTLELAYSDPEFRSELRALFDHWRATIEQKISETRPEGAAELAAMVVASYSGAMALSKVEQDGGPLRLCAKELKRLL